MITVPRPAQLNGTQLAQELRTAGFVLSEWDVVVAGNDLRISGVEESQRAQVEQVIAAHVPQPDTEREEVKTSVRRLRELKAKGWSNLTAADRNEVLQHLAVVVLYLRRGD